MSLADLRLTCDMRLATDMPSLVKAAILGIVQGITEFLPVTESIRDLILERRPPSEIRRAAETAGMSTLRQAGIEKILSGETTMKEVNRMTFIG